MTTLKPVRKHSAGEEGYLLLGLVVVCFLLLLVLGVAAPRVAKELERDREVESEHRAQEYVRAIQLFYKKNSRYPTSMDELMGKGPGGGMSLGGTSTNVHYLRQEYKDPITNGEYRLIHFGEAKTEVKGFFGEPLQGAPVGNLGSAAGMVSNLGGNSSAGASGSSGTTSGSGASTSSTGASGSTGSTGTGSGSGNQTDVTSTLGGNNATSFQGSKGAIIGVGSNGKGHGLVEWNGSENIEDWEFLYDPRVELLKARVSIFGGSPAANGSGSFGSLGNGLGTNGVNGSNASSTSNTPTSSAPTTGTSGTGTNPF
ncbi:type II secretion system protein [Terriglobus sp. ADX1]|uniref:type II secretion system protein n=1 Tax=Terriglobus sp. ADX1 TaxID=2794063 RepID=UPI002FE6AEC5